jgi:hypothetical protein
MKSKPNKTGIRLEEFVEKALADYDYTEFWNHKASAFANRKSIGGKQYMKQLPPPPPTVLKHKRGEPQPPACDRTSSTGRT